MNPKYLLAGGLVLAHFATKAITVSELDYELGLPKDFKLKLESDLTNSYFTFVQPIILKNLTNTAVTVSKMNIAVNVESSKVANINISSPIRIAEKDNTTYNNLVRVNFKDLPFAIYSILLASKNKTLELTYKGSITASSVTLPVNGSQSIPIRFK